MRRIELITVCEDDDLMLELIDDYNGRTMIQCETCGHNVRLDLGSMHFRCRRQHNYIRCNLYKPFFDVSNPFHYSKLPVKTLIYILYEFSVNNSVANTAYEYSIGTSTVSRTYKIYRELLILYYMMNEPERIGGVGVIVEWDESILVSNKNHTGRLLQNQKWLFGGVERGNTRSCFVEYVQRRDTITLADVVRRRIRPWSIIHCDCWRAYDGINELLPDYHLVMNQVNHSENFVDPITGAHTQSIEGFWSVIKRKKRMMGTNLGDFDATMDIIAEIIAKRIYGRTVFEIILAELLN